MSLLDLFIKRKKATALVAKERLQIILAHERTTTPHDDNSKPSWLPQLQRELVTVIAKYTKIDENALTVNVERRDNLELLEINVTLAE